MRIAIVTLGFLTLLLVGALRLSIRREHEEKTPSVSHEEPPAALVTHPLVDLGIVLTLPQGWSIAPTMRDALTVHDQNDELTYVFIEPESHYYHNPSATGLDDYASSYRGRDIDVVVDSTEPVEVDNESALFQKYRAGDIVDGELDSTSLASISDPSQRYVLLHPVSGRFIIISYLGDDDPKILREVVGQLRFIRE